MFAELKISITSVLPGLSSSKFFGVEGSYHAGIGIDPDMPSTDSDKLLSGLIRPTAMEKFSSTTITAAPLWIVTNPKDALAYVYDVSGKVYSIDSSLLVGGLNGSVALTSSNGNGAAYYDNYIYFPKQTDIARYGPLNGAPVFSETYWTVTLSKTALSNTTYPSIRGIQMPNHVCHRHTDGKLYICDVSATNKGILSYVATTRTTVEGDTDNGSAYNALDFDYGYYPTSIETYGTDLAVALIEGVQTGIKQKPAVLSFWNTTDSSFSKLIQVEFPDPIISAMKNVNGVLHVWSGNVNGGVRHSIFAGGYSYQELCYDPDGYPPLQGAVDAEFNRVVYGNIASYPESAAMVTAYGSRSAALGLGRHNILKTTSAGANPVVTAVKYIQTTALGVRQPVVGWKDDSAQGIDKSSTTYGTSVYRSAVFRIGRPFVIRSVSIPLEQPVAANHTATVKLYTDNGSNSVTVATINNTNYPNSDRRIATDIPVNGLNDLFLEIRMTGTALLTVGLPINIEGETKED